MNLADRAAGIESVSGMASREAGAVSEAVRVETVGKADRIPFSHKLAFSMGGGADVFGIQALTNKLWLPFFNIGLGMNPLTLGFVLMGLRVVEAFLTPVVGVLSDNTRTRWGRRRPWIAVGAVLMTLTFPLMFLSPATGDETALLWHVVLFGTVFWAAYVVWSVPYFSLGLELTPNYDERTRLGAWMSFLTKLALIPAAWILLFASSDWFVDSATGKPQIAEGVRAYGLYIAPILLLVCAGLPALVVRERYYAAEAALQPKERFWTSIRESVGCGPLWPLMIASALLMVGLQSVQVLGVYVNIYYVFEGDVKAASTLEGLKFSVLAVAGMLLLPLLTRLSERYDKRTVTIGLVAAGGLGQLSNLFLLRPDMPYLQLIPAFFSAGLTHSVWMFVPAMKADVTDYDELHTGRRREGSLNALFTWFFKLAMVLSAGVGGIVLAISGFDVALPDQPAEVLWRMVLIYSCLSPAFFGLCIACFFAFDLGRDRMAKIRTELEARRGFV